ncbi:MAG TPA: glycine/sarcosine/betaine reductase component B subunit [Candidatus Acidoferrales bacterium]|nr:glycine/sarcosine/betaine reductase component B subunit [Candidatus Acidoferrales bacterium]
MQLTLARHPIAELRFGASTYLDKTTLVIDREELGRLLLADGSLQEVRFEIVHPGESCRAGPVFDIVEPRAKEPGCSPDFPGVLGPPLTAGSGTTRVLAGAAVTVLSEKSTDESRGVTGRVLEMSGAPAEASPYSSLRHLVVVPRTRPGLAKHAIEKAYRLAGLRCAVHLARAALGQPPESTHPFEPVGPARKGREGIPRVAYVGQIFSRQRKPAVDEPVLYGLNTDGMLPVVLDPDEWLDGAILPSYHSSIGGAETYFYQNHPVILELYRRHHAGDLSFVGTVATVAGSDNFDRDRNCRAAANLVRWVLSAEAAVLTKYGGGVPHADLAETARLLEGYGIRTAVMVTDSSRDRRVESALLFNFPEVNAIVYNGGNGTRWTLPRAERIVTPSAEMAELLGGPIELGAANIIGVTNQQGASRLRGVVY